MLPNVYAFVQSLAIPAGNPSYSRSKWGWRNPISLRCRKLGQKRMTRTRTVEPTSHWVSWWWELTMDRNLALTSSAGCKEFRLTVAKLNWTEKVWTIVKVQSHGMICRKAEQWCQRRSGSARRKSFRLTHTIPTTGRFNWFMVCCIVRYHTTDAITRWPNTLQQVKDIIFYSFKKIKFDLTAVKTVRRRLVERLNPRILILCRPLPSLTWITHRLKIAYQAILIKILISTIISPIALQPGLLDAVPSELWLIHYAFSYRQYLENDVFHTKSLSGVLVVMGRMQQCGEWVRPVGELVYIKDVNIYLNLIDTDLPLTKVLPLTLFVACSQNDK